MRTAVIALIAGASIAQAQPASAQTAQDKDDVRCILVFTVAGRDPKLKDPATQATFYYLGRLDGKGVGSKLESTFLSESKAITSAAQVQSELNRCGEEVKQRSVEVQAMFGRLQKAAQPPGQAKAPPAKPPAK